MLAVDVDELLARVAQLGRRAGTAVDVGARTPSGVDHPPQDALTVLACKVVLRKPRLQRRQLRRIELGAYLGTLAPGTHHRAVGAAAQDQRQRIHQHGLARTGLAGQHREAARELEPHPIGDDEILERQREQHRILHRPGQCPGASLQPSFSRSMW
jgi:hypothetical protein